jgi:hypothetical protein
MKVSTIAISQQYQQFQSIELFSNRHQQSASLSLNQSINQSINQYQQYPAVSISINQQYQSVSAVSIVGLSN